MSLSLRQSMAVGKYIFKQKLKRRKRYPLVLMLEPLFRCNLECKGCGKIQFPNDILDRHVSPEQAWAAVEECGVPVVSIAGGEPLIHPQMPEMVRGLVERKKFVYLCTNAVLLEKKLDLYTPSPYLTLSVHIDGTEERHDEVVCRKGVYKKATQAILAAKERGFRVTANSTIFSDEEPGGVIEMFAALKELGVDGITISPGYAYDKAPDQQHFLGREQTRNLFKQILADRHQYPFNHSPQYLDFLEGKKEYQCTPWGNPTYNVFGWQKPCYLMADGYAETFDELMEETDWERYGTGRDPRCDNCMAHCGYEASAALDASSNPVEGLRAFASHFSLRRKKKARPAQKPEEVPAVTV